MLEFLIPHKARTISDIYGTFPIDKLPAGLSWDFTDWIIIPQKGKEMEVAKQLLTLNNPDARIMYVSKKGKTKWKMLAEWYKKQEEKVKKLGDGSKQSSGNQ